MGIVLSETSYTLSDFICTGHRVWLTETEETVLHRLGLPFVSTTARKIICQRFLWERLCSKPWSCLTVLVSHKLSLLLWVSACSLTLSSEVYSGVLLVLLLLSSCKLHFVTGRTHKAKFPLANDCVKTQNSLISGFFLKQIPLLTLYSFDFKMELNAWLHFD